MRPRKANRSCDNDTSDEYYSALSPVSTSSASLSTASSSLRKAHHGHKSPGSEAGAPKKGILDVVNRLKSQRGCEAAGDETRPPTESKATCRDG